MFRFHCFTVLLALTLNNCSAFSQDSSSGTPSATNIDRAQYPIVDSERRVTFRIKAPQARSVQLIPGGSDNGLGPGPYEMKPVGDGYWTCTTAPAVPGFHYYWFSVDGTQVFDAGTYAYFGYNRECSGVEIPDPQGDFYAIKSVPHGAVLSHWYHSPVTGRWRRALVYTPAGYDQSSQRFPVLYLQHGSGESERGWTEQGKAHFIIDNLIAAGKCKPMIIVMENGMIAPHADGSPSNGRNSHNSAFAALVMNDLIPEIDRSYRTLTDPDHRAIAGLSMGAGQAAQIGLGNIDSFHFVGMFSGGRSVDQPFQKDSGLALFWAGAGQKESERFGAAKQLVENAKAAGINSHWHEVEGTAHEWQTWRYCLNEFAPLLFGSDDRP